MNGEPNVPWMSSSKVAELERWHRTHDDAVLVGIDRIDAIAQADGGSPSVQRDALRAEIAALTETVNKLRQTREDELRRLEREKQLVRECRESVRVLLPNPEAEPLRAQYGFYSGLPPTPTPRHIEVVVTPHEIRQLAVQKAQIAFYSQHAMPAMVISDRNRRAA